MFDSPGQQKWGFFLLLFCFETCELCILKICIKGSITFFTLYGRKHTCLQSFEKVQGWGMLVHLTCFITLSIWQQGSEISWYISHILGGVRWRFGLPRERIRFLSRKPTTNQVADKHATYLWAHAHLSGGSDVIPWLYSAYVSSFCQSGTMLACMNVQ